MSQRANESLDGLQQQAKPALPGLDLKAALQSVGSELKQAAAHGAHELAAALFNGNSFVMYPRGSRDDGAPAPEHAQGLGQEAGKTQQREEQGRGGMGM